MSWMKFSKKTATPADGFEARMNALNERDAKFTKDAKLDSDQTKRFENLDAKNKPSEMEEIRKEIAEYRIQQRKNGHDNSSLSKIDNSASSKSSYENTKKTTATHGFFDDEKEYFNNKWKPRTNGYSCSNKKPNEQTYPWGYKQDSSPKGWKPYSSLQDSSSQRKPYPSLQFMDLPLPRK